MNLIKHVAYKCVYASRFIFLIYWLYENVKTETFSHDATKRIIHHMSEELPQACALCASHSLSIHSNPMWYPAFQVNSFGLSFDHILVCVQKYFIYNIGGEARFDHHPYLLI